MKTERGKMRLERGPWAEDGQTGRTERDWSMDGGRRDNILDSSTGCFVLFFLQLFLVVNHVAVRNSMAKTKM